MNLYKALSCFRFILIILSMICISNIQAQNPARNWGVRLGLNAVSTKNYEAHYLNEILKNSSYTNKNGYLITGFTRFNINRIFLQPELAWNEYRRSNSFSIPTEEGDNYNPPVNLNISSKVINTNFLVGYNIVQDYPFLFGVFFGSSFTGTYRTDYSIESYEKSYIRTGLFLNYTGILGLSIIISRIYFDLRYEMFLPDANVNLKEIPDFPESYRNISLKKTEAILSFSFGVMF